MKPLGLKDRNLFERYLKLNRPQLSSAAFVNVFIWSDFFDFKQEIIGGNLCVFAKNKIGCFLCLPPLGKSPSKMAVKKCFEIMDRKNIDENISRIENVEKKDLKFYERMGLKIVFKGNDYLYRRTDLVNLNGNKYKPKRSALNYFIKHNSFEYLPFEKKDIKACLALYRKWQSGREKKCNDAIYRQMLSDNYLAQKTAMDNFKKLELMGRIIRIKNKIQAYAFGFRLNPDTFCVLFEVANLGIKGIANFLFREFCKEQQGFSYINCMDDSGLESLKRVKLSYRPCKLIPAYIVTRG